MSFLIFFKDFIAKHRLSNTTGKRVFDHYFFDFRYYLQKDASIEDFAMLINTKVDKIEKISLAYYRLSFSMLINEYRFQHFVREVESPISTNLSIESVIKLSGFESNEKFVEFVKTKEDSKVVDANHYLNRLQ